MGGSSSDYEPFTRLKDDIGENPARWLDREILGDDDRERITRTLIDGMDSLARVRAWKAVERQLAARDGREPREGIISRLEQREAWLEEHGDRWDRLDAPADDERVPSVASVIDLERSSTYSSPRAFGPLRERRPELFDDDEPLLDPSDSNAGCTVATDGGSEETAGE